MLTAHRPGRLGEKELGRELWSQESQPCVSVRSVYLLTQEETKQRQCLSPAKRGRPAAGEESPGLAQRGTSAATEKHFCRSPFMVTQGFLGVSGRLLAGAPASARVFHQPRRLPPCVTREKGPIALEGSLQMTQASAGHREFAYLSQISLPT